MFDTPDLSKEFHPMPKTFKKKKTPSILGSGKKTQQWEEGRAELKRIFQKRGITSCEIQLEGCLKDNYLSFAHIQRRGELSAEETINPNYVVLACQPCHHTVDFELPKAKSYQLLQSIVDKRGRA